MADPYGNLSPEEYQQQQAITRQQQLASMLMQNNQQPQGQMVSGRYVPTSFFQNILPLVNTYVGKGLLEEGDVKAAKLAEAIRDREAKETQKILGLQFGSPDYKAAVMPQIQRDDMGNVMPAVEQQIGQAPNQKQALFEALKSQSKAGQMIGQTLLAQKLKPPEQFNLRENEKRFIYNADTGITTEIAKGNPKERVASGVNAAAAERLGFPTNPDLWTPQQRRAVDEEVHKKIKAGASVNTNIVSAANKFAGGIGEKFSTRIEAMYDAAERAPQQIAEARRTIDLVNSGALTGPAANVALTAAKIFNVLGANNQDTIKQTELLFSNRGKALLGSVKQSGLAGSQGLTEGERKFLTAAEGGSITLNAETLKAMAGLEIKNAVQNQKKWNEQVTKLDKDILKVVGAGPVEVYTGLGTVDKKLVDKY